MAMRSWDLPGMLSNFNFSEEEKDSMMIFDEYNETNEFEKKGDVAKLLVIGGKVKKIEFNHYDIGFRKGHFLIIIPQDDFVVLRYDWAMIAARQYFANTIYYIWDGKREQWEEQTIKHPKFLFFPSFV